ncbi:hypothetical protein [Paenibacillus albus]|uniref:DUF4309 domain-containing protein n=1 Tax=Paenibacillus albus TaxID=2495582 RepID=A0A3Q8X7C8_9BACL|nr:hypothetical protein [Paenibacillus albus]AZN42183.1 hypothetical protein EJC50_22760 [Paenibacillus albus]
MDISSMHSLRKPALTGAACLLILLLAGCQLGSGEFSLANNDNTVVSHDNSASTNEQSDSPQKALDTNISTADASGETTPNTDATTVADATTESTSTGSKPTSKLPDKNEKKWDSKAPKLHGIAIGDSKASWDSKLGKPTDIYKMDDDKETITVSEYASFSVGYGADKLVKFVDVFGKSVGTGLNGLRVGDSQSAVVKSLGKPDIQTASVLAYKGTGALLKLDLDPANSKILSIKLFSNPN